MHSIPDILQDLRDGKIVVLADDADRENEGDLVCAAEFCSPEVINFMLSQGRGMLFVALDGSTCDRLDLPPQGSVNTTQRGTAYTITVDAAARFGITTGVSTAERAQTIRTLADPETRPIDLDRPGHIQPLRARDGGVLVRTGHTEGITDLCRLAGLSPVGVGIEVMNADGTMARQPELDLLCETHGLKACSVADIIEYRMQRDLLVERIDTLPFTNDLGDWTLIAYRSMVDPFPHVALVCGELGQTDGAGAPIEQPEPTLVRMHSQNLLGDVFGDLEQPSQQTLRQSMQMIQSAGRGAVVYLRHEGMGRGLLKRLQTPAPLGGSTAPALPEGPRFGPGLDTLPAKDGVTAAATAKTMDYGIGSQILRDLGLSRLQLITNHPFTPAALSGFGLVIDKFVALPRS
ncbi:MAG: 3,4-dihydroxy-2-butanone-4-phosphate synthase [Planctomycetota bacterium]